MGNFGEEGSLFSWLLILAAAKFTFLHRLYRKRLQHAEKVGVVSAITLFPIKSCGGIPLEEAICTNVGLKHGNRSANDRHFVVVDENDCIVDAIIHQALVVVRPSIHGDMMHIDAPGMSTLKVRANPQLTSQSTIKLVRTKSFKEFFQDLPVLHMGEEATVWFSAYLKFPAHLVCSAESMPKRELLKIGGDIWNETARPHDAVALQNRFAFLLVPEESVEDLNSRLDKKDKVSVANFRPNITVSGCSAFDEDTWDRVFIGDASFTNHRPCDRCLLTTINPVTGIQNPELEPIKTLRSYRIFPHVNIARPVMGATLVSDLSGTIKVGDPVYATRK